MNRYEELKAELERITAGLKEYGEGENRWPGS